MSDLRLAGKVALVTGAARGIGRAIALALATEGADVVVADLHLESFAGEPYYRLCKRVSGAEEEVETARAVSALGRRSLALAVDVADAAAVAEIVAIANKQIGSIDILVNNAGIVNSIATIEQMTPEAWAHEVSQYGASLNPLPSEKFAVLSGVGISGLLLPFGRRHRRSH